MKPPPRFILAGTYVEAREHARRHDIEDWRYAASVQSLRGYRGFPFTVLPGFWKRRDAREAEEILTVAKTYGQGGPASG